VLGGAFPALLMDQVKIVQVRLPVRDPLEQDAFASNYEKAILAPSPYQHGATFDPRMRKCMRVADAGQCPYRC
jgi:hypothetical protein